MRIDPVGNISVLRFLFKSGRKMPTTEQLTVLLEPNQVVWMISEVQRSDFVPSQTDWRLIYWLMLEPRIKVNDLAKRASVTEKTVARGLVAMSKKRVLGFSVQYNRGFFHAAVTLCQENRIKLRTVACSFPKTR